MGTFVRSLSLSTFFVAVATAAACGGTTAATQAGSSSASGSVDGVSLPVAGQVGLIAPATTNTSCGFGPDGGSTGCVTTSSGQTVVVALANRSEYTCSYFQAAIDSNAGPHFANTVGLELAVGNNNGNVTTGTYDVIPVGAVSNSGAGAYFSTTTATCSPGLVNDATGGTVTLSRLSPTEIAGSYDVTFGAQGSLAGSFDVPVCDLPDAGPTATDAGVPCVQ